jgi:predicted ArsR family transcriptional regulator
MPLLVHDTELLWVTGAVEPATTREIADQLPLTHNSTYVRLRSLARQGRVTHNRRASEREHGRAKPTHWQWSLTASGREQVARADLPPADETDFESYFADRTSTIDTAIVLDELAVQGEERAASASDGTVPADAGWASVSELAVAVPFARKTIRSHLQDLRDAGVVERDTERASHLHYWRLTDRGRARVTSADVQPYGTDGGDGAAETTAAGRPTLDDDRLLATLAVEGADPAATEAFGQAGIDETGATQAEDGGWVPSTALYDALPFSKMGIREKLHRLKEAGLVEHDPDRGGQEHYWRLTDAGHERLADGDGERDATPA